MYPVTVLLHVLLAAVSVLVGPCCPALLNCRCAFSGFRPGHSTETAVLRVSSDILLAVDRGDVAALILLDLSAAFDTVDYEVLLHCLQTTYGISDVAHRWFRSYLLGRS